MADYCTRTGGGQESFLPLTTEQPPRDGRLFLPSNGRPARRAFAQDDSFKDVATQQHFDT